MFKAILHVGKLMWHYYFGVDSICTYVHSSAFQSMSVSNNNRVQRAFLNSMRRVLETLGLRALFVTASQACLHTVILPD
jgi:hypothetical protein